MVLETTISKGLDSQSWQASEYYRIDVVNVNVVNVKRRGIHVTLMENKETN